MIKNIIFDFGDVFINLNKAASNDAFTNLGITQTTPKMIETLNTYEKGLLTSREFLAQLQDHAPHADKNDLVDAWNAILGDLPEYRLRFLEILKTTNEYRLFLLSNTNDLHIEHEKIAMGNGRFERFRNCFEQFYLSYQLGMRKPDDEIFNFVLEDNNLKPDETYFVDDSKENTDAARKLGLHCWNLQVGKEDVVQLSTKL